MRRPSVVSRYGVQQRKPAARKGSPLRCGSRLERQRELAEAKPDPSDEVEVEVCATCGVACPVQTDTRAYVDLIRQGRYEEAFEKIREFNPFPSACGLICHHPCEQECRRQHVDDPVALRHLKRFINEQVLGHRKQTRQKAEITHPETIGVVGSGPSGLTVAHDCIKRGYAVTVYDSQPKLGGLLACAVPTYRLRRDILQQDLDDILALGVEAELGVAVGTDITLDELRKKHAAVVLAVGLSESTDLPLENKDHPDVHLALPFLRAAALDESVAIRDHVIVVGGGNVAVDVARTAVRLGAKTVKMVCLENAEEIPAWDWERREALEEAIEIIHRRGPTSVVAENGRMTGLVVREVERVFDEDGRFAPTYFDERLSTIDAQMVIIAIGQRSNLSLTQGSGVELNQRGRLVFDLRTMATSAEGVFACGEVVTGAGSAVEAVASGHRAAQAVLSYLKTGRSQVAEEQEAEKVADLPEEVIEKVKRIRELRPDMILCSGETITVSDLPKEFKETVDNILHLEEIPANANLNETLDIIEKKMVERALKLTNYVQAQAAELLGIGKSGLNWKIKKFNLDVSSKR